MKTSPQAPATGGSGLGVSDRTPLLGLGIGQPGKPHDFSSAKSLLPVADPRADTQSNGQSCDVVSAALPVLSWVAASCFLTLFNKYVITGFKYPFFMLMYQQAGQFLVLAPTVAYRRHSKGLSPWSGWTDFGWLERSEGLSVLLMVAFFWTARICDLKALQTIPASLNVLVKSGCPLVVMVFSYYVEGKVYAPMFLVSGSAIVIGVILTAYNNPDFEFTGFMLSLLAAFATAMSTTIAAAAMGTARQLPPTELSMHMSMWATTFCALPFFYFEYGDLTAAIESKEVGILQFDQLTFGIFLALMLNVSKYAAVHRTSSLYMTLLGEAKLVAIVVFSWLFFHDQLTPTNWLGVAITASAFMGHTYLQISRKGDSVD